MDPIKQIKIILINIVLSVAFTFCEASVPFDEQHGWNQGIELKRRLL